MTDDEDSLWFRITRPIIFAGGVIAIVWFAATVLLMLAIFLVYGPREAFAHDGDPSHDEWYMGLMQPDNPSVSCCGVADAYWCDDISVKDGKTFCAITDDRVVPRRPSLPMGMQVEIPDRKLKWDQKSNPTGHAIVFLSSGGAVYCFVQGGGV